MHELSITKDLIELIKSECNKNKITNPKNIVLELGSLTTYKKEPILYYYNILKKEQPLLHNSALIINEIQAEMQCNGCNKKSKIKTIYDIFCPCCDSTNIEIIQGRDIRLLEIQTG
ncbi:hydrogenase maturation nickel metallochaperone HypA [Candidatus Woesearchaeota archaeon]|nr:hydrogenase maturation nickel metallochaperone HypA [Candidatus Woesearchaeota archaeon]